MLASIDVPVEQLLVIDNGAHIDADRGHVIRMPGNLGIGASWNLAMKATPWAEWWAHINDDVIFAPGDLEKLAVAMADPAPHIATLDGFSAFGINRATLEAVGWFDENFHPAYLEDCDYRWRCHLADVPIVEIEARLRHDRSSTIADPFYGDQNSRTYRLNYDLYLDKWGGRAMGGERYAEPFNGMTAEHLCIERLKDQAWKVK